MGTSGEPGWITDDALRSEVVKRCVGEQMCRLLEQVTASAAEPLAVSLFQSGAMRSIHVGAYEIPNLELLKTKLAQFPEGSAFVFVGTDGSDDGRRFAEQVRAVFAAAGMALAEQRQAQ